MIHYFFRLDFASQDKTSSKSALTNYYKKVRDERIFSFAHNHHPSSRLLLWIGRSKCIGTQKEEDDEEK